jgi:polysaccharide export outer membrane protein
MNMKIHFALCIVVVFCSSFAFAEEYIIGDGDMLSVSVWGAPELSSAEVRVRPDGKITLPAAGDVAASGKTPEQLSQTLGKVLRKFVKKPLVTVAVTEITNNRVYVFGDGVEVQSGVYDLPGRTTLLRFLCRLGNFGKADLRRAYVYREGMKLDVDFYRILVEGDLSKDIELLPGDILYIPDNERNRVYVMGEVNEPKFIIYQEGMRLLDAVLEAEGFTEYAKETNVRLVREGEADREIDMRKLMKVGDFSQNVTLMPGDYIFVRESIF